MARKFIAALSLTQLRLEPSRPTVSSLQSQRLRTVPASTALHAKAVSPHFVGVGRHRSGMKVIDEAIARSINKLFGGLIEEVTTEDINVSAREGRAKLDNLTIRPSWCAQRARFSPAPLPQSLANATRPPPARLPNRALRLVGRCFYWRAQHGGARPPCRPQRRHGRLVAD